MTEVVHGERGFEATAGHGTPAPEGCGIVHQHVEPIEASLELGDEVVDGRDLWQGQGQSGDTLVAAGSHDLVAGRLCFARITAGQDDGGAELRQAARRFFSDSAAGAGDDTDSTLHKLAA